METTFFKSPLNRRLRSSRFFRLIGQQPGHVKKVNQGLYDAGNLADCPWPNTDDGQYARRFLTPLITKGVSPYIKNVQTDLRAFVWDQLVFPISINESEYDNSYVCSPFSYFISYARESLDHLSEQKWIVRAVNILLAGAEKILRSGEINKTVVVNNWFYSTNLYPSLKPEQVEGIANYLKEHFPSHAIVFRSVDPFTNPTCYQTLQNMGFTYIASRQIFYMEPWETTFFESRLFKSDLKLLHTCGYTVIDGDQLTDNDLPRMLELYQGLFIDKFSALNPQFTEEFLRLVLKEKLMDFKALKKEGRIDGIVGFTERNGEMFCPFFGYDQTMSHEISLYRQLSTVLLLEADRRHLLFHQSSGASMFKKIRKAKSCIEYLAVYYRHLPLKRQMPWMLLEKMCNSIGVIFMKRY